MWQQDYDPLGNAVLSTLCAGLPIAVLMGVPGIFRLRVHLAVLLGLAASLSEDCTVCRQARAARIS
ncbi:MAG: hypothetical protein HYV26_03340 [Candidatus Hydrogenedentes bacterium]|nr:hypothetical protein [Candidatus Hydrogenedentota bacterium]